MKTQKKVPAKNVLADNNKEELTAAPKSNGNDLSPNFIEAEKMFDRFFRLNEEIGRKAFELFLQRGTEFDNPFENWLAAEAEVLLPIPVEITENKNQFNIKATIHGFKPEEIEVSVKDNLLILSGETEETKEDKNTEHYEWHKRRFFRAFPLSSEIEMDKIKGNMKDDVLLLALPKMPEHKPKHINIA